MRRIQIVLIALLGVLALQGCDASDIFGPREYDAVNLTVVGTTYGTPLATDIHTPDPNHNYSTSTTNGFTRLLAHFGQDVLQAEIKFWTLPPETWRQTIVQFRLSNKAADYRVTLQDNPYKPAKVVTGVEASLILSTEFYQGIERPAKPMRLIIERKNDAGIWEPANITPINDSTIIAD